MATNIFPSLNDLACRYIMDDIRTEDLPGIAIQALEAGYDTRSLRQLAGLGGGDLDEIRSMFARSMEELEVVFPTREEAALATARAIAREVVGGIETPYDGANRIWLRVSLEFEDLKQLLIFGGLVSTIDDDPDHRADYEQRIVAECKKLLEE